ncbi:hypothetical protein [uncultured Chryseobacterium sp.]|uniref:hypothetical protein n=1 Tax=uncultured Chryseobacterium sp. TaxID=259322 RepID=UPI0025FA1628|nr:hypothetical protein [uncultured Chryseobacterium sp.]
MNFAYTEEERKEHDHYRSLIQHLDKSDIPKRKIFFSGSHFDKHYHDVHYNHTESSDKKKERGKDLSVVLYGLSAITLFAISMAVRSCLNLF